MADGVQCRFDVGNDSAAGHSSYVAAVRSDLLENVLERIAATSFEVVSPADAADLPRASADDLQPFEACRPLRGLLGVEKHSGNRFRWHSDTHRDVDGGHEAIVHPIPEDDEGRTAPFAIRDRARSAATARSHEAVSDHGQGRK